jgi:hypothetical protein
MGIRWCGEKCSHTDHFDSDCAADPMPRGIFICMSGSFSLPRGSLCSKSVSWRKLIQMGMKMRMLMDVSKLNLELELPGLDHRSNQQYHHDLRQHGVGEDGLLLYDSNGEDCVGAPFHGDECVISK